MKNRQKGDSMTSASGSTREDAIVLDEGGDEGDVTSRALDSSRPTKKLRIENVDSHLTASDVSNSPGNMLNPSTPIKLFATVQDEALRRTNSHTHWSYTQCWTLREMLGLDGHSSGGGADTIDWLVLSNFIVDFDFLLQEVPELVSIPTALVVYGHADNTPDSWQRGAERNSTKTSPTGQEEDEYGVDFLCRDPSQPAGSTNNPLKVSLPFSCHHTKMFLVGYSSGRLRVMVHTSNMRYDDIHLKCQGAFIQDFPLKSDPTSFDTCDFEETLISYLGTYHYHKPRRWRRSDKNSHPCTLLDQLSQYDFSTAKGVLIPSTPGFHKPRDAFLRGYLKVRQAILEHAPCFNVNSTTGKEEVTQKTQGLQSPPPSWRPIVCQFSSIGSLSEKYLQSLWNAWDVASVHGQVINPTTKGSPPQLKLVYPTHNEIVQSVEGIRGGGSVPGRSKNVNRPFLQHLYHRWTEKASQDEHSNRKNEERALNKGQNVPHIKSYYQMQQQQHQGPPGNLQRSKSSMRWFVLSSHNLSKAAWGEVQNGVRGETLKILHWELGVFMSPQILGVERLVAYDSSTSMEGNEKMNVAEIPLPYPSCPDRYGSLDEAWTVDRAE